MPIKRIIKNFPIALIGTLLGLPLLLGGVSFILANLPEPIGSRSDLFLEGAKQTTLLSLCAGGFGIVIGLIIGVAKLCKNIFIKSFANGFIWLIRGTPLLVQILFIYYALPVLIPILKFNEFTAALIALALNVGAYNAEVVRSGILAIPRGQAEAALNLGLSSYQTLRWIILPQAFRIMLPSFANNFVALIKDSSLASSIGLLELSLAGNRISSETFHPLPVLTTVAMLYLTFTSFFCCLTHFIEKRNKRAYSKPKLDYI